MLNISHPLRVDRTKSEERFLIEHQPYPAVSRKEGTCQLLTPVIVQTPFQHTSSISHLMDCGSYAWVLIPGASCMDLEPRESKQVTVRFSVA